jgi:hypothetical protein
MILSSTLVEEPASLPVVKERLLSVYPALLSKVAEAFKESIVLTTKTKDSIKYKDVFDGKEAVVKKKLFVVTTRTQFLCRTNCLD